MGKKLNQGESIDAIADATGLSRKDVKEFFTNVHELLVTCAKKGGAMELPGIGKVITKDKKARTGRNPHTGKAIKIAAKTVVQIKVTKALKNAVQ